MFDIPTSLIVSCLYILLYPPYLLHFYSFFFFNDTATPEIYTLSYTTLFRSLPVPQVCPRVSPLSAGQRLPVPQDRKSTRLNSSHSSISYAVFCLKKKK